MLNRNLFECALVCSLMGLAGPVAAAQPAPLFSPLPDTVAQRAESDQVYSAFLGDRAIDSIALVQADATQIDESVETLLIDLAPGLSLRARQQYAYRNPDGTIVWSGLIGDLADTHSRLRLFGGEEIADTPQESIMIVRNGDLLTGTVRTAGRLYQIRPLRNGGHAINRIDEALMPPDHPADYRPRPVVPFEPMRSERSDADAKANTVVRVGMLVAQSAANAIGDVTGFANLAVAESNQGFSNSGVSVTLQLAGVYTIAYNSAGFSTDLSRFRGTSDGHLDSWHGTRNSITADLSVLVVNNSSSCGIGYLNSSASTAFSVVHHGCATGYYSFGHEIGHNFGAHHNPEAPANNTTYPYGHGYLHPGSAWRTIMAYNCSAGCPRINYWSNPSRTYNGAVMGTTSKHNNTRVLNNRRGTVAGFR